MALLGMGANVQSNGYFPGYYSTSEIIFGSEGSTWASSNVNTELKSDYYHIGSLPLSTPCNLVGYNKELLKQTILKHEAIFRDQIHELHRVYHKQRELMDEIKGNELHEHNSRLEASWSNSSLSSKNAQKICCSPNLPWSTSQSSVLIAETFQLPLAPAQEKSRQIGPAPTVTEECLKDSKLSESKYRKVGKKILDLRLPADEYIDIEEAECLENEKVTEVPKVSAYSLNRISKVVCDSDEKPPGTKSHGFADLNVPCKLEEEAAAKSYDLGPPAHHRKNPFYDLSRRTNLGSQIFRDDVIQNLNKRQDLEAYSDNLQPNLEKKHERLSSGQHGGVLDSFSKVIYPEKQPVSVESLSENLEQFNDLHCFHSSHQINRGSSWSERIISGGESSAQIQGSTGNGLLGPSSVSRTCFPYHIVSGVDMISSGILPAELWKKQPLSDFGQCSIAVQAVPCFSSSASLGQSSKSLMGIAGFNQNELYRCISVKSGPNLDSQNFLLGSNFCSNSKMLDLPSISINDPNKFDISGSSDSHELGKYVKGSDDKNLNLNITPAGYSDTTASQSIQIKDEENKFQDSMRGFPWLKEKPVCKQKPDERISILHSNEESDLRTKKPFGFHSNGKPRVSPDLQSFDVLPSELFQSQSKNQSIEEIEKGCISDVKSPCNHVSHLGDQMPADDQKKHESLAGIIDLNSCVIEDENMPMDVDFQAPASPENKECSPPRGESDENQLEMPFQLAEQEGPEVQEEQVRNAAEALVSISGFMAHNALQMTTCSSSESFASSPLHWFAGIVSKTVNHSENEIKADFSGKANDLEDFLRADMDYFEFMTLKLTETMVEDCHCKSIGQTEPVGVSTSPTRLRKGRTNRGRWRRDFQSEILPSLASLSRYEVTEDLQTIGSLVAAGTRSETGSLRSAGRNVLARGRKRSCTSTSNITGLKQITNSTELSIEKRGLISWGKTCRKRRGQRFPTTNPQFILRSI